MVKRIILNGSVVMFLLFAFVFYGVGLAMGQPVTVVVDGQVLALDQPAMMDGERVLVPLRGVFESLGAQVTYDASRRSINAVRGGTQIQLTVGSRQAYVNGEARSLDAPPVSMGGRVMVPLRFVSEALGAEVKWQAYNRTVSILNNNPAPAPLSVGAPRIDGVTHNASGTLMPGDTLTVVLRGASGGQASFDITNVATGMPMQETSPGLYQGSYTVDRARQIAYASVTGHLRLNAQESTLVAIKPVAFGSNPGNTQGQANPTQMNPTPGSQITSLRPQVSAFFQNAIQPSTVGLTVDGIDHSSQASTTANSVSWSPSYDLSAGEHVVILTATGGQGEQLRRKWNFFVSNYASNNSNSNSGFIKSVTASPRTVNVGETVTATVQGAPSATATMTVGNGQNILMNEGPSGTYTGAYTAPMSLQGRYADLMVRLQTPDGRTQTITDAGAIYVNGTTGGALTLNINGPAGGTQVPQTFDVAGTTQPNSTVRVRLLAANGFLGNILGIQQEIVNTQVRSDYNGNFVAHVNAGNASSGSKIAVLVQAQNDQGSQSPETRIDLTRQ